LSTLTRLVKHVGRRLVCLVALGLAIVALGGAATPPVHASSGSSLGSQATAQPAAPAALRQFTSHRQLLSRADRAVDLGVGGSDATRPLLMNPTLTWNTFLGGSGSDSAYAIVVDANGAAYITGYSDQSWGSPIRNYVGKDAFVAKVDSTGALVWNTFLGGGGADFGQAIALDENGNVYVAGYHYYTTQASAFVAKLDSNGVLLWTHSYGGDWMTVEAFGIAVDATGNIYLAGYSNATWGSPVRGYTSLLDAFVAKLDSSGTLLWNTFLGGTSPDTGWGIAVDHNGSVYVAGKSEATWPGSVLPIRSYSGGPDAYVAKLDSNGGLTWYTFLGGGGMDNANDVAVDSGGSIYVAGNSTASWAAPVRPFSGTYSDGFVAKMNSNGGLIWNTFIGGGGIDYVSAVAVDSLGNSFVTGESMAAWGSPFNPYKSDDAYVAKVNPNGALTWNTFTGGSAQEMGRGIALDVNGNVYFAGLASATWGSPVRPYSSDNDAFVAKIQTTFIASHWVYLPMLKR
jgi:hypothetical protein